MPGGWIKLHRAITDWEWYRDGNTMRLFVHLLLTACREGGMWHGVALKPGYAVASYPALAATLCMTAKQVRIAFEHLRSTGEITMVYSSKNGSVWSVNRWHEYQITGDEENYQKQPTGQAFGQEFGQEKGQAFQNCNILDNNDLCKENYFGGQEKGQEFGQEKGQLFKNIENNNSLNVRARVVNNNTAGIVPYPTTTSEIQSAAMMAGMMWDDKMAQDFLDHYTATGWQSQTGPLRDWRYKLRAWYERDKEYQAKRNGDTKDRTKKGI